MFTEEMLADVRCPKCPTESLKLFASEKNGSNITTGTLHCAGCNSEFQILGGVPDLVPSNALSDE
ncbi:MAG: Trm112 family protein [Fuerstiella sp.]